jgi:hypothetical protein
MKEILKLIGKHTFWVVLLILFLWWKFFNPSFNQALHDVKVFVGVAVDSTKDSREKLKELKEEINNLRQP